MTKNAGNEGIDGRCPESVPDADAEWRRDFEAWKRSPPPRPPLRPRPPGTFRVPTLDETLDRQADVMAALAKDD